jgi:queuine tRNA-ribosyltransferase subunit QTRTD1
MSSSNDMTANKVIFEVLSHVDPSVAGPRLGRLALVGRKELKTPNFIAVGSRGVVPHMTPDVILSSSEIGGVHMALEDCKSTFVTCISLV